MANSFDKMKKIRDDNAKMERAKQVVADSSAAFAQQKTILAALRQEIVANPDGYYTNPDDTNYIDALIADLKLQMRNAGA